MIFANLDVYHFSHFTQNNKPSCSKSQFTEFSIMHLVFPGNVCHCQSDSPSLADLIPGHWTLLASSALTQWLHLPPGLAPRLNIFIQIQENQIFLCVFILLKYISLCVECFLRSSITVTTCVSSARYNSFVLLHNTNKYIIITYLCILVNHINH